LKITQATTRKQDQNAISSSTDEYHTTDKPLTWTYDIPSEKM